MASFSSAEGLTILAIVINAAVLSFVAYDFVTKRLNHPQLKFRVLTGKVSEKVYGHNWLVENVGHDAALDLQVMFQLRSEFNGTQGAEFTLMAVPYSFGGDLIPTRISADWAGLVLVYEVGAPQFVLQVPSRKVVKVGTDGKFVSAHPVQTLPVGRYSVKISASGTNLRDTDRDLGTHILEFPGGVPSLRSKSERDPTYAEAVEVPLFSDQKNEVRGSDSPSSK